MYYSGKGKFVLANSVIIFSLFVISCVIPTDYEKVPQGTFLPAPETVKAGVESLTSITVSWTAIPGAESYKLYRAGNSSGPYRPVSSPQSNSYTDIGVSPDTEYYYRVASITNGIEGEKSEYVYAATRVPAAPADIKTLIESATSIALSWEVVPGALTYKVYRAAANSGPFSAVTGTEITVTQYADTTVSADSDYFYKVSAVNGIGEGAQSETVYESTKIPARPTGVATFTLSKTSIEIHWNAVPGAASYKIYQSSSSSGTYVEIGTSAEPSFAHNGIVQGSMYFYKVSAANVLGESPLSDYVLGEISVPPAPTNVVAEGVSDTSIKISWDIVPGASLYSVYNYYYYGGYYTEIIGSTTNNYYIVTGLAPAKSYTFKIQATNNIGKGGMITISTYTQPIALTEGAWYPHITGYYSDDSNHTQYYSFPANNGTYYIMWNQAIEGDGTKTGNVKVSAYWNSNNSLINCSVTYFSEIPRAYNTPQIISAPTTGFIILKVQNNIPGGTYAIRYYR